MTKELFSSRSSRFFQPATFEERGTAAPFTTPVLTASRVRPDERQGLALLMPQFSGTAGVYVIPWKAVPEVASMTVHDRALYEEILVTRAVTPDAMRKCSLRLAATGLAGPDSKAAADIILQDDTTQKTETHFFLMLRLLQMVGLDHRALLSLDPKSATWEANTRTILSRAAIVLGVHIDRVYAELEEISTLLTPVGLTALNQSGRLRTTFNAVARLQAEARRDAGDTLSEAGEICNFAATVAQHTTEIAERLFLRIDDAVGDVPLLVTAWEDQRDGIVRLVDRISWLLDGWDQVLASWSQTAEMPPEDRLDHLSYVTRLLPIVPRAENGMSDLPTAQNYERTYQTSRVRGLENWRSGKPDAELIFRIEAARARAVAVASDKEFA